MPALPPLWKREIRSAVKESVESATRERAQENEKTNASIAAPLNDLIQEFKAYQEKQDRKDEESATRERVTIAALILTVIFTFLTMIIFHEQLGEMEKAYGPIKIQADAAMVQAEAAKEQAEAARSQAHTAEDANEQQLRAYLFVDHELPHISASDVDMDVVVHFAGVTPAYELWLTGTIKIDDYPLRPDEYLGNTWTMKDAKNVEWPNFFGGEARRVNISGNFSSQEIQAMTQNGQRFYVFGSVCHLTNLSRRHQYDFCFSFAPDGKPENSKDVCERKSYTQPRCPRDGWPK